MKQLTIRLNDDLHKQLKYLSVDIDISINDYITTLINDDLKKRKEQLMDEIVIQNREAFKELAKW